MCGQLYLAAGLKWLRTCAHQSPWQCHAADYATTSSSKHTIRSSSSIKIFAPVSICRGACPTTTAQRASYRSWRLQCFSIASRLSAITVTLRMPQPCLASSLFAIARTRPNWKKREEREDAASSVAEVSRGGEQFESWHEVSLLSPYRRRR